MLLEDPWAWQHQPSRQNHLVETIKVGQVLPGRGEGRGGEGRGGRMKETSPPEASASSPILIVPHVDSAVDGEPGPPHLREEAHGTVALQVCATAKNNNTRPGLTLL